MKPFMQIAKGSNDEQIRKLLETMMEDEGLEVVFENRGIYRGFWVYYYQSKLYLTTKNDLEQLFGNAPIVIDVETFNAYVTGTAHEVNHYIDRHLDGIDD